MDMRCTRRHNFPDAKTKQNNLTESMYKKTYNNDHTKLLLF